MPSFGRKSEILSPKSETDRMEAKRQIPAHFKECVLKKQTQFLQGQNDVKSVLIMVYGDFNGPRRRKNKAKQSQYAGLCPEIRNELNWYQTADDKDTI